MPEILESPVIDALITSIIGPVQSNANGSYVRLENGLQICWHKLPAAVTNYATSPLYIMAPAKAWTYPAAFIAAPIVVGAPQYNASGNTIGIMITNPSTASCGYQPIGMSNTAESYPHLVAIGRWK